MGLLVSSLGGCLLMAALLLMDGESRETIGTVVKSIWKADGRKEKVTHLARHSFL